MKAKRRYADGDLVRANENIGDDTRMRALEFLRGLRGSGEAAPSTDVDTGRGSSARAKPKAEPMPLPRQKMSVEDMLKDTPTPSRSMSAEESPGAGGRMMRALFPNPSWPGKGIESSLPAAMAGMPAAARGAARAAQGLTSAAQQGFKAGRAERAAERSEARYPTSARESDRMSGEGPVRTSPPKMPKSATKSTRERSADEERMQNEGGRYAKGGKVGGASRRADGIAQRGKTRGRIY